MFYRSCRKCKYINPLRRYSVSYQNTKEPSMTENDKIQQAQAWNHLVLSAQQRTAVLNFYFVIATALAGGLFVLVQKEQTSNIIGIPGWLLSVLTLIFWQWDKRSASFVKNAEVTLQHYEEMLKIGDSNDASLFKRENKETETKKNQGFFAWPYLTFTRVLRYLYLTFATIGIMGITISILECWNETICWIILFVGLDVLGLFFYFLGRHFCCLEKKDCQNKNKHG